MAAALEGVVVGPYAPGGGGPRGELRVVEVRGPGAQGSVSVVEGGGHHFGSKRQMAGQNGLQKAPIGTTKKIYAERCRYLSITG